MLCYITISPAIHGLPLLLSMKNCSCLVHFDVTSQMEIKATKRNQNHIYEINAFIHLDHKLNPCGK